MSAYVEVTGHQPDLQKMTKGDPVKEAQLLLDKHCYGPEPDGYFGDQTERCLNEFKDAYGLMPDSIVDQATWAVLNGPPLMVAQLYGQLSVSGNVLHWTVENAGCPTIPAYTVISQCWAFERADITNLSLSYDFGPTSDQPIRTQEPFAIDLLTLFPNDGQYTVAVQVGPDVATLDYDVVSGQVI